MSDTMKKVVLPILIILILIAIFLFFWIGKKKHVVSFKNEDGTVLEMQKITKNGLVEMPDAPEKEGYVFLYWTLDGERFDFNTKITKDMVLIPKYQLIGSTELLELFVSFDADGGNEIETQTILQGEKVIRPEDPTKKGYKFVHWMLDDEKFDFETEITADIVLKAKWEKEKKSTSTDTPSTSYVPTPTPKPKPKPKPTPKPDPDPDPTPDPKYTISTQEFQMGSPQVIVIVKKDGKEVAAKEAMDSTGFVLGENNNSTGKILMDASEFKNIVKVKLTNGSIVSISK